MSEEEILKINRRLEKMIEKSEIDESMVKDLFSRLQDCSITITILKKTSIGKTVNALRRIANNEQINSQAKTLLKNWQKLLPEKSISVTSSSASSDKPTKSSSSSTSSSQELEIKSNKSIQSNNNTNLMKKTATTFSSDSNFSNFAFDNLKSKSDLDPVRSKSCDLLSDALSIAELPEGSADPIDLAMRIEEAIFKEFKNTEPKYRNRVRSRVSNLRDLKNPSLRIDVLLGRLTPERLAVMTADEMASEALKQERSKLNDRAINEYQLAVDEGTGTDLIQCKRCKQNNCAYTEVQTRSADEPMTLFVFCKSCGNRWKM